MLDRLSAARCTSAAVRLAFASFAAASSLRALHAQTSVAPASSQPPSVRETVIVLGEIEPVTVGESARPVVTLELLPLVQTDVEDVLRTDASVDIQQRAPGWVMNDVSIRGASFEQTLVLLNGLRLDDVETSHFNLDAPVPMSVLAGADVLHGAGSTLYGSDAIGGVIDLRTKKPDADSLRLRAGGGSFASDEEGFVGSLARARCSEILAGDRARSEGFQFDRDYRTQDVSSESWLKSPLGTSDLLFAGDERVFGANQFFGNYPSSEHTKGWFGALTQQLGEHTTAAVAYRRHTDEFVLFRYQPSIYENNHIDQSYEGSLRDSRSLHHGLTLLTGLEETTDQIDSTNLGDHGRNRGAGYGELQWRGVRGSLTGGLREEVFSGGRVVSSPMGEGTLRLGEDWKVRGAVSYGFRLPTFLDLYYSDPTTVGNANLAPESAWSYEGGTDWYPSAKLAVSATVFTARQKNTIDYTRAEATQLWQATNLGALALSGVESQVEWRATSSQQLRFSWTYLHGSQSALGSLQSEYVFNYPVNNGRTTWLWHARQGLLVSSQLGVLERTKLAPVPSAPYAVWDLSIARDKGRWQPYVRATNLSSTGYQEIQGVPMPPRAVIAGVEIVLSRK
jgi:iron complex outermembrane receptor protein